MWTAADGDAGDRQMKRRRHDALKRERDRLPLGYRPKCHLGIDPRCMKVHRVRDDSFIRKRELHRVANATVHDGSRYVTFKRPPGDHRVARDADGDFARRPLQANRSLVREGR